LVVRWTSMRWAGTRIGRYVHPDKAGVAAKRGALSGRRSGAPSSAAMPRPQTPSNPQTHLDPAK
jgi:hypothetical protein